MKKVYEYMGLPLPKLNLLLIELNKYRHKFNKEVYEERLNAILFEIEIANRSGSKK